MPEQIPAQGWTNSENSVSLPTPPRSTRPNDTVGNPFFNQTTYNPQRLQSSKSKALGFHKTNPFKQLALRNETRA
jgi:hypothetical protein